MSPIANLERYALLRTYHLTPRAVYDNPDTSLLSSLKSRAVSLPLGSRFAGRHAGGASREHIYSGSYYGSGYPYGSFGSTWVGGRPFPFYYWPIYLGPREYYGASEYGPANSTDRPGGPMYTTAVFTANHNYNTPDVYRLLGDRDSVNVVLSALHVDCDLTSDGVLEYDPAVFNSTLALPHIESIVQYYRASSFALALNGYNNSAATITPAALSNNTGQLVSSLLPPSPLPSNINTMALNCINRTVGKSLPLMDLQSSGFLVGDASAGAMVACMHLVFAVVLVIGLVKGVLGWLSTPRGERGSLLDLLPDLVSVVSAFSR